MEWGHASKVTLLFKKDKGVDNGGGRLLGVDVERGTRTSRFSGISQPSIVAKACVSHYL